MLLVSFEGVLFASLEACEELALFGPKQDTTSELMKSGRSFMKEKRATLYISLHPQLLTEEELRSMVRQLAETFPFLYQSDMINRFPHKATTYPKGDHRGIDILCTWRRL